MKVFIQGPGGLAYMRMFHGEGFDGTDDIDEADVVCFTGGADINPKFYGEEPIKGVHPNHERDERDAYIYGYALAQQKFMVGICRGGQFLNAMSGGKLWQDVDNHCRHHIATDVETNLKIWVSSTHHQQMRPGPKGTVVMVADEAHNKFAWDETWLKFSNRTGVDIDVEAMWYPETKCFCFQPHPEFDHVQACRDYFFDKLNQFYDEAQGQSLVKEAS